MNKNNVKSLVAGLALVFGLSTANADERLEGGWIVASWEDLRGEAVEDSQPGMFIFTGSHYAIMYTSTAEPRPENSSDSGMTDEEKLTAYDSFTANAGGYVVDGNTFTAYAFVAKSPDYMGGFPENGAEYEFARDGDNLTITRKSEQQPMKVVLFRVEGGENAPYMNN